MARRSYRDIFLQALGLLSGNGKSLVGNKALQEELKWNLDRYQRIKSQLVDEGMIVVGRGRGGTVGLAVEPGNLGLRVFVSYSHVDETLKTELLKHLTPLQRLGKIDTWHDQMIRPGDTWEKEIAERIETADVILMLISIDFINSSYCYDDELDTALERQSKRQAVVIPIILRHCLWQHTPFAKLQALPKDAKAVTAWSNSDEAFTNIAESIRQEVDRLLAER